MTEAQAEGFYAVHAGRPFYTDLVAFMISGPVVVQVLEGEDAIARYRDVMGATNPAEAAEGTIRKSVRREYRAQLRPRLRRSGNRGDRNPLLLQRRGDRGVACAPRPAVGEGLKPSPTMPAGWLWTPDQVRRDRTMSGRLNRKSGFKRLKNAI